MTSSDPIRILIVENEGLVGCDMAASLGKLGHHVVGICASGEEALSRFEELRPDLVLLYVHLSGQLDGIDTAAAAKADKDDEPADWSVQPKQLPDKHA